MREIAQRLLPWVLESDAQPTPEGGFRRLLGFLRLSTRVAVLLAVFMVLNWVLKKACHLPAEAYESPSLLWELLIHRGIVVVPGVVLLALLLFFLPQLRQGWDQFEGGRSLRWFVGGLAGVLAWFAATDTYNAYIDQFHAVERVCLVLLAGLVFWRPVFVLPFAATFWMVIWQLNFPDLGFPILLAFFQPLFNLLILFFAAFLLRAAGRGRRMHDFIFLALCLVAANFWAPALAKLRLGWIAHGHLYCILPAAYTHGWLAFLNPTTIESITHVLAVLDWPMRLGALVIECGALFICFSARTAKWLLVLFTALLGAFFLMLGYLFWQWMFLQFALWALLFRSAAQESETWRNELFTRERFALSLVVIGASGIWFSPARLAWFDTPLANTIRIEGVTKDGKTYELPGSYFAPYNSHLAMATFTPRLIAAPTLTGPYGVTDDRALAGALLQARTTGQVRQLEAARRGDHQVNEAYAKQFDEFVRRTVAVTNRRVAGQGSGLLRILRAPPFLWTFPRDNPYRYEEPLETVRVYRVSSFYDGRKYHLFRKELLRSVEVSPPDESWRSLLPTRSTLAQMDRPAFAGVPLR